MAARRERERRRPPTERRYTVETGDAAQPAETDDAPNGTPETVATAATVAAAPKPSAVARTSAGGRPSPKPFSDYRAEYAYVTTDLRRVALVMGSLLVALIVLHFLIVR
jgi:hypothetical protein